MQCKDVAEIIEQQGFSPLPENARGHVTGCASCSSLLADFELIAATASQLPSEVQPPTRGWGALRAQLEAEKIIREPQIAVPADRSPWWQGFGLLIRGHGLAAAAIAFVMIFAAGYFQVTHRPTAVPPIFGAGMLMLPAVSCAAGQKIEKHLSVKGRPVVMIQNVANGRIEVKSWKNSEVVVSASQSSDKIGLDMEQADERIEITANILDPSAQQSDLTENIQLTVPEETELQIKTQTGLIYVEQVIGDMKLESVAGDVHLKEVSGYIIVHTTGGSLVCTHRGGKLLGFNSTTRSAPILPP